MEKSSLDERKHSILLNVIDEYIQHAEPVGSRSLSKKHVEKLSPATIRNVMSDLEDLGFLKQPHPSSGRVPTDKGYRFFVDHLLRPPNFLEEAETFVNQENAGKSFQEVLEKACINLSQETHHTGLVMIPSFSNTLFKHIEFIKVGQNEALAVFFSELGVLQNKVIPIEKEITQDDLTSISRYLNAEFSGKSIKRIRQELLHALKNEKAHYNDLMKKAMEFSSRILIDENEHETLLVEGALNLFDHPEFKVDLEKIKSLLKTLEDKTKLVKLLDLCLQHDGMTIFIGEENQAEEMESCSLIAQNYQIGEEKVGTIAIVGPKRMDYKSAISLVNHTAKSVSKMISEQNRS